MVVQPPPFFEGLRGREAVHSPVTSELLDEILTEDPFFACILAKQAHDTLEGRLKPEKKNELNDRIGSFWLTF